MRSVLIALLFAWALTGVAHCATFRCGFSWRADGEQLYQGAIGATACQAKCESLKACKFFYTTEDPNNQALVGCHVMGDVYGNTGFRDDGVIMICARDNVWNQLRVPDVNVGNTGTLIPAAGQIGQTGRQPLFFNGRSLEARNPSCSPSKPHCQACTCILP